MNTYQVVWVMDIDADSHEEAALKALKVQRNPESTATVFAVNGIEIDLDGVEL